MQVSHRNQDRDVMILSIKELFVFSPFGLCCRQCKVNASIQMDNRSIAIHLKKHSLDSTIVTVRSILDHYRMELQNAKAAGVINPFRMDQKTYAGFQCICGQIFSTRRDNAIRHCKKSGCNPLKMVDVELIKLCCGRYVTQAQIDTLFIDNPPRITTQFDYPLARAILLPYLPPKEKHDHTYTHMYYPLIANAGGKAGFIEKIKKDFVAIHTPASKVGESMLLKILGQAESWLLNYAQKNIMMVPGNLRGSLQTFEGGEVDDVSQRITYRMQHDPTTLLPELKKLLSFAFRRGRFASSRFDEHDDFAVAYFLKDFLLEVPSSVASPPFVVEFCLMYPFRVPNAGSTGDSADIKMISCDTVSSMISRVTSILKAAVCSVICSFSEDTFTRSGRLLVQSVRSAPVIHILSPMVRQIKEMYSRLPKRQKTILDPGGNVVVDQYSFRYDDWSRIVPTTVSLMHETLTFLANGSWWEPIVDPATPIKVRVDYLTGDMALVDVIPSWNLGSCLPHDQLHYFTALLKMAFHGFGGGSARMSELEAAEPTMLHCLFCNHTLYYSMASLKGFKSSSSQRFKKVERKLPPVITRYFLLFRSLVKADANHTVFETTSEAQLIFPKPRMPSDFGIQHVMRNIFNLDSLPDMRQIRQFWACVSNYLTGDESDGNNILNTSASAVAASKFGHSERTHAVSYASQRYGGAETHFNAFHFAIGDTSYNLVNFQSSALSLGDIRSAMNLRYPNSVSAEGHKYLSIQQKELVEFAYAPSSNNPLHCFGLLAPGQGKSESYIIPTIARQMANQKAKMIIHVSPYSFLAAYQFEMAIAAMESVGFGSSISICVFKGGDIMDGCLPEELSDSSALPNLLFLNLNAMSNLFTFHFEVLKSWVPFMDKIVLDEVHTIFSELSFREKYKVCAQLPLLGIPILALSGSVPLFALPKLAHRLCLTITKDLADLKVIHGTDIVGDFPKGFAIRFSVAATYLNKVATFVVNKLGAAGSFHVFVSEKDDGARLLDMLSSRCDCKFISSNTNRGELNDVASKWRKGEFRVLISTSIALVGNENPMCRYIACAGYLYDSMQLVQAFGRLRSFMRSATGMIYFAAPETLSCVRMKDDEHRLTRLLNEKLVSNDDIQNFKSTMTSGGVQEWHMIASHGQVDCALKILSSTFGKMRTNCGACPFCRRIPITTAQSEAACRIATNRRNEQSTGRVLEKLALICLVCKKDNCRGLPILKMGQTKTLPENRGCCFSLANCYQCGVSRHNRDHCFDKSYLNKIACCECWVFKGVPGSTRHETRHCPVKGRLRRLLSDHFLRFKVRTSFKDYIETIYTSSSTFCEFMSSIETKYMIQK
jgi:hypothetical protein